TPTPNPENDGGRTAARPPARRTAFRRRTQGEPWRQATPRSSHGRVHQPRRSAWRATAATLRRRPGAPAGTGPVTAGPRGGAGTGAAPPAPPNPRPTA